MLHWLPENISKYAQGVDTLFNLIYWITLVVLVLVFATLIVFLIMYRHREGHRAEYIEGSTKLEIIWTAATTVIVFGLAMLSFPQWNQLKAIPENPDYVVQVRAEQFNWDMIYPGPDNEFGTDDDLEIENELYVPIDKDIQIELTSIDVIHSFFIPNLRLKQDALPNRVLKNIMFNAQKTGRYEIPCAELCGFGHAEMRGYLIVKTQEEYDAWVKEQWPEEVTPTLPE